MRPIDADALPKYNGTALNAAEVARAVELAPTIEPGRKKGKWVRPRRGKTLCQCSECGTMPVRGMPNFCPNCGAEMKTNTDQRTDCVKQSLDALPTEYEYALQIIAEMFDTPCGYTVNEKDVVDIFLEHAEGYCEGCNNYTGEDCWRKFFEILRKMGVKE